MDISKYNSVGEWYKDAKENGYSVPLEMCRGLEKTMKKDGMTLSEAYNFLLENKKVVLTEKTYIFDISVLNEK